MAKEKEVSKIENVENADNAEMPVTDETAVVEDSKSSEVKATLIVEIENDIPYGPKAGRRSFEKIEDAKAYAKRFGGKFVK